MSPPRLRLQRVRARRERDPLRTLGVRGHRRLGEILGAESAQRVGTNATALGHRLRRVGARDLRPKTVMHVITEVEPKSGALLARNAYNTEFPDRIAFLDVDDATRSLTGDRASSWDATARSPIRRPWRGRASPARWGLRSIRVAPSRSRSSWRRIRSARSSSGSAWAEVPQMSRASCNASADPPRPSRAGRGARALAANTRGRAGGDPGRVARRACQRLAAVPDGRVPPVGPQRLLPVGRCIRLPRPAPGRDGARSLPTGAVCAEHLLRCAGRQFVEGDVQHWWHPPSDGACARAARTTTSGCRWRRRAT